MYAHIANIPLADMRLMNDLRNFGGPKSFLCAAVAAAVRLCLATQDHGFFAGAAGHCCRRRAYFARL